MRRDATTPSLVLIVLVLSGCGDGGGTPDAGPPPMDQCLNPTDVAIARMTQSGDAGIAPDNDAGILSLGDYYAACAVGDCLEWVLAQDMEAIDACMVECTATTPAAGLTEGCRLCYDELVVCAAVECANFCILDPYSQPCRDCYEGTCVPPGRACTGLWVL